MQPLELEGLRARGGFRGEGDECRECTAHFGTLAGVGDPERKKGPNESGGVPPG